MKFDPQQISMDEITAFKAAMENVFAEDYPANIQEAGTPTVRTASGFTPSPSGIRRADPSPPPGSRGTGTEGMSPSQPRAEETAHVDTFVRDRLPPKALWPTMDYSVLPALAAYPGRLNVARELLERPIEAGHGSRPALMFDDQCWSLAALNKWVNRVANVLTGELGVVPGNRLLLRSGNTPWLAATWYAALKAGAIPIATMPTHKPRELDPILRKAQVQFAVCDHRLRSDLEVAVADVGHPVEVITFGDGGHHSLEARAADVSDRFPTVATAADDVAVIGFTSGSTGAPKGTVHFHRDLLAAADCFIGQVVGIRAGDIVCGSPQAAFLYGLCAYLIDAPRFGAASVLVDRVTPQRLLQTIERYRATVCFSTPSGYKLMLDEAHRYDLSSLRVCVAGGEPLAPAVYGAWAEQTGCSIINGLGISELLHIFISAGGPDIRPGAIGRAVPGFEVRVVNDALEDLPPGEIGQMIVRGPNGCRYLDDEARQRSYVRDGWNLSGDLCHADADGYIYYHAPQRRHDCNRRLQRGRARSRGRPVRAPRNP